MAIQNRAAFEEVLDIFRVPSLSSVWKYEAEIITPTGTIPLEQIKEFREVADFENDLTGYMFLHGKLGQYTYKNDLYPNRNNLKVKVIRRRISDRANGLESADIQHQTFDAKLMGGQDVDMLARNSEKVDPILAESSNRIPVRLQLTEQSIREILVSSTGGIFRDQKLEDIIKVLLGYGLNKGLGASELNAEDYFSLKGVVVAKPTQEKAEILAVPVGTELIKMIPFIQNEVGLYSAGAGYYIRDGVWHIYPLYDHTRYDQGGRTLTVINLAEDETFDVETTYKDTGDTLTVVATGRTIIEDKSESSLINLGSGIRYVRPSSMFDGWHETTGNKTSFTPEDILKEISIAERADGVNKMPWVDGRLTVNPYPDLSKMSKGLGRLVTVRWANSDHKLVYPGMPARLVYMRGDEPITVKGTLLAANTQVATLTDALTDTEFRSYTELTLFVQNEES